MSNVHVLVILHFIAHIHVDVHGHDLVYVHVHVYFYIHVDVYVHIHVDKVHVSYMNVILNIYKVGKLGISMKLIFLFRETKVLILLVSQNCPIQ